MTSFCQSENAPKPSPLEGSQHPSTITSCCRIPNEPGISAMMTKPNNVPITSILGVVTLALAFMVQNQPHSSVAAFVVPRTATAMATRSPPIYRDAFIPKTTVTSTCLFGKKSKRKAGGGGGGGGGKKPQNQEKQSVKEARFDAATRQFMFTLSGLTKILPDKSKKILDNINVSHYLESTVSCLRRVVFSNDSPFLLSLLQLSFYPGAKVCSGWAARFFGYFVANV